MNDTTAKTTTESYLLEKTLSDIVTENYQAARVFEKYGLDFCCGGKKQFGKACSEKGVNPEALVEEIQKPYSAAERTLRFNEWELDFLIDYIVNNHHQYVREMIPVVSAHVEKVAAVHGENHPETVDVAKIFGIIYKDLKQHMMKEEQILFPYIKYMVKAKQNNIPAEAPYFGQVAKPIKMMEAEHQAAGDGFEAIRKLTNDYTLPEDACNTFKAAYKELKEFEEDLHKHVHLENNILFPKSIELEHGLGLS
jgi:regulator of cell morphogenesis and NO signaling